MKFKIDSVENVFKGFYSLIKATITYDKFNGGVETIERVIVTKQDAVCVTLIDPIEQKILFVRQFRPGCVIHPLEHSGWILEPVAGHVEDNEDVLLAAEREVFEETGLVVTDLQLHSKGFTSVGMMTELHYNIYGFFDSTTYVPLKGIGVEDEDIEVVVMGFEEAKKMVTDTLLTESFLISLLILDNLKNG